MIECRLNHQKPLFYRWDAKKWHYRNSFLVRHLKSWVYLLVFAAGGVLAMQAAVNGRLGQALHHRMHAVLASFIIGTIFAISYCLLEYRPTQFVSAAKTSPWWIWLGGLMGVFFVWSTIFAVPRIGVVAVLPLVVAGQLAVSLLIEYFGWFRTAPQPLSTAKVAGCILVLAGAVLFAASKAKSS
ncbi:MAG: DMT family transporter [Zavarzinella sp.]